MTHGELVVRLVPISYPFSSLSSTFLSTPPSYPLFSITHRNVLSLIDALTHSKKGLGPRLAFCYQRLVPVFFIYLLKKMSLQPIADAMMS